jgi:hypothetical protein
MCFTIWICLIVLCKTDFYPTCCYSLFKVLNENLNLKFHQMDFWFEFIDIHMNKKTITCHDYNGFKWKNINICPILTIFLCGPMPFLAYSLWLHPFIKSLCLWFFLVFKFIIIFIFFIFFIVAVSFMFQNDVSKWDVNISKHLNLCVLKNT